MTPELHQKAKQLFLDVCDLDEPSRHHQLDERCADDPLLRAEVESLLQHHTTQTLLEPPPDRDPGVARENAAGVADRWLPGSVVANRYRILNRLGKGGMGEVYRAEDTLLSRPVALKFITAGRGTDPLWLSRFYAEARTASTITHRHVCRIYDIGEVDGEAFISMEYIDGENLSSLLRRVGRVTVEKAGQIARELCLGLGAVHERGILHRDLKPANVMIDGRGEVRITDFGIAISLETAGLTAERAGTPGFMAPEVARGEPATIQSDLYSLGMILYQMVTGRDPFGPAAASPGQPSSAVAPPSRWTPELTTGFEQIILDCLQADPAQRPGSVYDVLAGLPGGEALAAVVAAGDTPPVELVARSRTNPRWDRAISIACAAIAAIGLAGVLWLADKTMLVSFARLTLPPDVLADRATQILRDAGYEPTRHRVEQGFAVHQGRWEHARATPVPTSGPDEGFPPGREVICYQYTLRHAIRQNAADLGFLESQTPETSVAQVVLNGEGQLREFVCTAFPDTDIADHHAAFDWADMFRLAGLTPAEFEDAPSLRNTSPEGEVRKAWRSTRPGVEPIHVEAVERNGHPVRFEVTAPGVKDASAVREQSSRLVIGALFFPTLALAVSLGWSNVLRRRSDHRGALRIGLFVFALEFVNYGIQQALPGSLFDGLIWLISGMRVAIFAGFLVWLYYNAVEPYVRRYWPHALISWTRVLGGRLNDPLIGRDILIGCATGVLLFFLTQCGTWLVLRSDHPYAGLLAPVLDWDLGRLTGYCFTISSLTNAIGHALSRGFLILTLLLLVRLLVRRRWATVSVLFPLLTVAYIIGSHPLGIMGYATCALLAATATLVLDRAGFLAFVVGLSVARLLLIAPLTLQFKAWYASQSVLTVTVVVLLIVAGLIAGLKPRSATVFANGAYRNES